MHVRRIKLDCVRGFERDKVDLDFRSGDLPKWTVIAGRNGSGKTTLLRAIALAIVGPLDARTLAQSFEGWVNTSDTEASVQVLLDVDDDDGFQGKDPGTKQISVGLKWHDQRREPRLERAVPASWTTTKRKPENGPWADDPQGWFLAGYGPFRRLYGHAADAQRLMSGQPRISRLATLFREDAALGESLEWLKELYTRELEGRQDAARNKELVLELLNQGLLPDPALRVVRFDSDGLWVQRGDSSPLLLGQLSDGYRAVVALVLDLLRSLAKTFGEVRFERDQEHVRVAHKGTVLIDEIDAHLHVSWQRRIGPWLTKHFPGMQFIVTTHSPFVCQTASESGLVLLPSLMSEERARIADVALFQTVTKGTVDDALLSTLFGLESTRSIEADKVIVEIKELERRVFSKRPKQKDQERLETLKRKLPKSPSREVAAALDRVAAALGKKQTA